MCIPKAMSFFDQFLLKFSYFSMFNKAQTTLLAINKPISHKTAGNLLHRKKSQTWLGDTKFV